MTGTTIIRRVGTVLVLAGGLLVINAMLTVVWQEPISGIYAALRQNALADDLNDLEQKLPDPGEAQTLRRLSTVDARVTFLGEVLREQVGDGGAVGRIRSRAGELDAVIVDGTSPADLRRGPGVYTSAALPGAPGTTAIAGHRTTYGASFRHLDRLGPGDRITIEMPYARITYRVQQRKIVRPEDVGVLVNVGYNRLVLTACHPLYSLAKRIVVFAREIDVQPRGAARSQGATAADARAAGRRLPDVGLQATPPRSVS